MACSGIGITMSVIAPGLIGGYTAAPEAGGLGLDQAHAGRYVTWEMLATALGAMASAPADREGPVQPYPARQRRRGSGGQPLRFAGPTARSVAVPVSDRVKFPTQ